MTVLRELIARIGFQVDKTGFEKAETAVVRVREATKQMDARVRDARGRFIGAGTAAAQAAAGVNQAAAAVQTFVGKDGRVRDITGRFVGAGKGAEAAAAGVNALGRAAPTAASGLRKLWVEANSLVKLAAAYGLWRVSAQTLQLASDAEETSNVLNEVLGPAGAKRVADWSATVADEVGRSKFMLRDFAAQVGAIAAPMTGSAEQAEEMSTSFAKLAVDLSSFFNATEDEALAALKSGLSGESEPLKRFGVVLQDATLQEFALAQGITKRVQKMSVAEKTALRFRFIMEKTKAAQGDAARTADGYANSVRALESTVKDLQTELGTALLPTITKIARGTTKAIAAFREWSKRAFVLKAAAIVLTGVLTTLGVRAAWAGRQAMLAWTKAALPFLPIIAGVLFLILLIDDLHALFAGGTSVIGHYLDTLFGIGTADAFVKNVNAGIQIMSESWTAATTALGEFLALLPDAQGMWDLITGAAEDFGVLAAAAVQAVIDKVFGLASAAARFLGFDVPEPVGNNQRTTGRGMDAAAQEGGIMEQVRLRRAERNRRVREESEARTAEARNRAEADAMRQKSTATDAAGRPIAFGRANVSAAPGSVSAPAAGAGAAGSSVVVQGGPVTINVNGGNPREVERAIAKGIAAGNRRTAAAQRGT